jgi:dCTP deaminase
MCFEAMVLSDRTIKEEVAKGRIVIKPLIMGCIQPASVDLHLDKRLLIFKPKRYPAYIDVRRSIEHLNELVELDDDKAFFLNPGEFVLVSTLESITLPDDIVGRLEGKSSLGRIGLLVHSTAGYVDPGWHGHLTIELSNVAKLPITLYYKMKIGQISFLKLTSAVDRLYGAAELGSKYQGQTEPTASKYHENFVRGL